MPGEQVGQYYEKNMDQRLKIDEKKLKKYLEDIDVNKQTLEKAVKISYQ